MKSKGDVRSWVVLGAAFASNFLNGGFLQIMGVYMVAWQDYFAVDATAIAGVASIMSLVSRLSGLLSGALCKRFGCHYVLMVSGIISFISIFLGSFVRTLWQLHIYALFAGFGIGIAYTPCFIAVSYRFKARLGLANGIISAGVGVGMLTMGPVIEIMCDRYGWKGALLIHSGIMTHRILLALLLKPSASERRALRDYQLERSGCKTSPYNEQNDTHNDRQYDRVSLDKERCVLEKDEETTVKADEEANWLYRGGEINADSNTPALRQSKCMSFIKHIDRSFDLSYLAHTPSYLILLVCLLGTSISTSQCRYYILPKLVYDLNVPKIKASFAMTILGACITTIRALHGLLLDSGLISVADLFLLGLTVAGTSMLINPFVETFVGQMVLAGFFGVGDGLVLPLAALMTKELVHQEKLPTAIGMQFALSGVGLFVGIQIMGRLYDATGSYDTPFLVFGVVQWAAALLLFYLTRCSRWRKRNT